MKLDVESVVTVSTSCGIYLDKAGIHVGREQNPGICLPSRESRVKSARKGKGTRSLWNLCFGFLLVSLNASCQKEQGDSGALRTEFDTVNGVSFSVNYGEPPLWALDTVLTLGGLFATEEAQRFGGVGAVVANAQGNIFVGDVIRNEILVFTPTGEHLRTIGREGAGPGEYRSPRSLGVLGDTLAVSDPINLRLGLFISTGPGSANGPFGRTSGA